MASPHFLIFPFMAKGHTIPLLHLARLLLRRSNVSVTIITTPLNSSFIDESLKDTSATIISLPFPHNIPQIPQGVESTDKLPSISLFLPFAKATKLMQPDFERALESLLPRVTCLITDAFLFWSCTSASKLQIPVFFFYGINNFAMSIYRILAIHRPHQNVTSMDELFQVPIFPRVKLSKNDLDTPFVDSDPNHPEVAFVIEQVAAASQSKGYIVNSFHELEPEFVDYWNREFGPRAFCVGPLCLAQKPITSDCKLKPRWIEWLDEKLKSGRRVLYVAFGTQAEISDEQYKETATGLDRSEVDYLWVVRSKSISISISAEDVEEVSNGRGLIVKKWVDQVQILGHEAVSGFMSHCGWNSVMESVSASVPILAWPMMAEQHMNARLVVEELGMGIRIVGENGSVRGFVKSEAISDGVKGLIRGRLGEQVRRRVKELGELANKATQEGGSSSNTLDLLIKEVCG